MKIDGRKSKQYIKNPHGLNIYIHKTGKDSYSVGINGTSNHNTGLKKWQAESEINLLIHKKN